MKNQNDLIISIVAIILAAGTIIYFMQTPRRVPVLGKPEQPVLTAPEQPVPPVTFAPSLPGGGKDGGPGGTPKPRGGGRMRA